MAATGSFRGGLEVNDILYGAWTDEVYTVNQSGESVLFSTLSSTDNIFIAQNNAATPDIAVIANGSPFIINTTAGAVQAYPDGDVGSPTCVGSHLGYFMFGYGNGDIQASDLNSTNINTLNSARTESNPDGVLNILSYNGQMYVFGEKTLEVWGDPVNSSAFPYNRLGFNILPGLKTPHAVAGWQPEFGHPFIWVGSDNTVRQIATDGYRAAKISTPDLDRLIAEVVFPTLLEANVYVSGGQAYWELTHSGENAWTWVYNLNQQIWFERRSLGLMRSQFKRSVPAFSKWLIGTTESADLFELDHTSANEAGSELVAVMESGPVKDFPNRQRITRADFDFTVGVGQAGGTEPVQTDPSVLIEVSKDGGNTWPVSWVRKLGMQGKYQRRVYVLNAGLSGDEGARWRWTVSDPVHVGFLGADMQLEVEKG